MQTRHHIFNFHIGFWGALLISAVVTIQSGLLLLMTSGLTMAQTAPFVTLTQPAADIQVAPNDAVQLAAVLQSSPLGITRFRITNQASGAEEFIPVTPNGLNFQAVWTAPSVPGFFTLVAEAEDFTATFQSSDPVTIEVINSVGITYGVLQNSSFSNTSDSEQISMDTSIPVDRVDVSFTDSVGSTPVVIQANSSNNLNWVVTFNPSSMALGNYTVESTAFLAGQLVGQETLANPINIFSPAQQDTIDINSPSTGATLSGPVTMGATSSSSALNVSFLIADANNVTIANIPATPAAGSTTEFIANLDTTTIPNTTTQPYALSVSGTINGTVVPSPSISIFVNNVATATPPVITTTSLPNGTIGVAYSSPVVATQGTPPYTFAIASGLLPTGLSLNGTTGVISGTPTSASDFNFTVQVRDSAGQTATQSFGVTIAQPPSGAPLAILSSNIADVTIAQPVTWTIQGTGGNQPYTWSVIAGSLPSQMQLLNIANEAVIQGTPDTPGPITFTLQLSDADGTVVQQTYQATLSAPATGDTTNDSTGTNQNTNNNPTQTNPTDPTTGDQNPGAITLTIREPIPTQTISGTGVLVRLESSAPISAPRIGLISNTGQNLLLSNNTAAAPFNDNSGRVWLFTLNTTTFPDGTYTLRADSSTNSGTSANPITVRIANTQQLQSFSGNISSPRAGQTVAGKVPLIATLNGEVQSLMFIVTLPDGSTRQITGIPNDAGNFEARWDSAGVPGGTVSIRAEVIDEQGVTKQLTRVQVNLREIRPTVEASTPEQVVDPQVVSNLQQGVVPEVPVECQVEEITDPVECRSFLDQRRIRILNEREQEVLEQEQLPEVVTRHINLDDGKATQKEEGKVIQDPLSGIIPIDKEVTEDRSVLVLGSTEPPAALKPFVQQTVPAVITFDQDGDGLPDDMERRYGTDINNPDTDGDGFDDATEIKNGFNPNGPGKLSTEPAPVERAILNKLPLDQPRFAGALDDELQVAEVISDRENTDAGFKVTGKAAPNSIVTLYIYSQLPIVVTTQTDAAGNWSYEMEDALVDGQHDIYVAVTNETGQIERKSRALSFFVDSAYAVSEEEFLAASSTITNNTSRFLLWYIIGGVLAVSLGGALFFFYFKNRVVIPE